MINLQLTEQELTTHVNALDAYARLIAKTMIDSGSAGQVLQSYLPALIKIDEQFKKLDAALAKFKEQKE